MPSSYKLRRTTRVTWRLSVYVGLLALLLLLALGGSGYWSMQTDRVRDRVSGLSGYIDAIRQADTYLLESHVRLEEMLARSRNDGMTKIVDRLELARPQMLEALRGLERMPATPAPKMSALVGLLGFKLTLFESFLHHAILRVDRHFDGQQAPSGPPSPMLESLEALLYDALDALLASGLRDEHAALRMHVLEGLLQLSEGLVTDPNLLETAIERIDESHRALSAAQSASTPSEIEMRSEVVLARVMWLSSVTLMSNQVSVTAQAMDIHTNLLASMNQQISAEIIAGIEQVRAGWQAEADALAVRGQLLLSAVLLLTLPILLVVRLDLKRNLNQPLELLTARIRGYIDGSISPDTASPQLRSTELVELAEAVHYVAALRNEHEELAEDLQALVDAGGLVVVGLDPEGLITFWNREASRMTGREEPSVLAMPLAQLCADRQGEKLRTGLDQLRATGNDVRLEVTLNGSGGAERVLLMTLKAVAGQRHDGTSTVAIGLDVTESRKVEMERERLGAAIDQLGDGMVLLDSQRRVRYVNQVVLGFDTALARLLDGPGASLDQLIPALAASDRRGQECAALLADWFGMPLDRAATPFELFVDDRRFMLWRQQIGVDELITFDDVTLERVQQAQLIQAAKLASLGEMATGIAHEINQPLNIIRLAVRNINRRLTQIDGIGDEPRRVLNDKLERVDLQISRASSIIDQLRTFGRASSVEIELIDTGEAVRTVIDMFGEQLHLDGIELVSDVQHEGVTVRGRKVQLEQVILNLIGNARDALLEAEVGDPRVQVRVAVDGEHVRLVVEDNGPGIAPEVRNQLFEPFVTTKEVGKGTGLGLSVSFGIIRDMGGRIEARDAAGRGTQFIIELPLAA